jgi:hypothetical protein
LRRSVWLIVRAVRVNEAEAALLHARAGGAAHMTPHPRRVRHARGGGILAGVLTRRFGKHRDGTPPRRAGQHDAGGGGG